MKKGEKEAEHRDCLLGLGLGLYLHATQSVNIALMRTACSFPKVLVQLGNSC